MSALRERAVTFGQQGSARMFAGRKGHGGGSCSKRVFNRAEVAALLAVGFEAGFKAAGGSDD